MAVTPINTLADIKTFAGITDMNKDAVITSLLDPCLMAIGNFCNRTFQSQNVSEYRDGNSAARMLMANYPITQLTSLIIDGVTIPLAFGSNGYTVIPKSRTIILTGYKFTRGLRNVQVQMTAGFGDGSGQGGADICPWPSDLKLAHAMYVVTRLNERSRLGIGSKTLAAESVTFTDGPSGTSSGSQGIPAAARVILENYMNTVPETGQ